VTDGSRQYVCYWYKPNEDDADYRCHYFVYFASQPDKLYFYSPYSQVYYGYYDYNDGGYHYCSVEDRRSTVSAIPASSWSTTPHQLPNIPGSQDGEQMPIPPEPRA
jgi:hypothetical protein